MALEAGRMVISDKGIETLNFELTSELGATETIHGTPTIELKVVDGDDVIEFGKSSFQILSDPNNPESSLIENTNYYDDSNWQPSPVGITPAISKDRKTASVPVRVSRGDNNTRRDEALDSIWEVICYIRTSPGGNAFAASMIVVGAG